MKKNIKINISASDLKKKLDIKDGYTPIKGKDYFDGKNAEPIDTQNIVTEASTRAVEQLKDQIPTIPQIIDNLPIIGEKVRDALELLPVQEKLKIEAIKDLRKELDEIKKKGGEHIVSTSNRGLYQLLDVNVSGITAGQTIAWDGTQWIPSTNATTDEKVKYDASDPTAGYLADKIVAGTGITIAEGTGADENKVKVTLSETFENYNKNLLSYPYTITETSSTVTTLAYNTGSGTITKTITEVSPTVTTIAIGGIGTKTITETSSTLTTITYS